MKLTPKAQDQVDKIKSHYKTLIADGFTDRNAHERCVYDYDDVNYNLVCLATDREYVDWQELKKFKLAE